MASVKLEIKGERSVVVMILDNVPSFRGSIPREVRIFFKQNLKFEVRSMQKSWHYGTKQMFNNDEFDITWVHYIEVQLCYWFKLILIKSELHCST